MTKHYFTRYLLNKLSSSEAGNFRSFFLKLINGGTPDKGHQIVLKVKVVVIKVKDTSMQVSHMQVSWVFYYAEAKLLYCSFFG